MYVKMKKMTSKSFEFYSLALVRLGYVKDVHREGGGAGRGL
jgi:hypothetical protein